jgi:hypothetical protein
LQQRKHQQHVEACVGDDEIDDHLTGRSAAHNTDVLQWWKAHAGGHPLLSEMARDYLAIPATDAPVERAFSGGADLVDDKRGSLGVGMIRASLCLRSWLKQLDRELSVDLS